MKRVDWNINWHTHTFRCNHAVGDVADYCEIAVAAGHAGVGFSDHTPLPMVPVERYNNIRMSMAELPNYLHTIETARAKFSDLRIYAGLECEYLPEILSFYTEELRGKYGLEYLIGASHWYPFAGESVSVHARDKANDKRALAAYGDYMVELIGSGLFDMVAHPDAFGMFYDCWDDEATAVSRVIIEAAKATGLPLEINGNGFRKQAMIIDGVARQPYPWLPFWEIAAEMNAITIIASDAHLPEEVNMSINDCWDLADKLGLKVVPAPANIKLY